MLDSQEDYGSLVLTASHVCQRSNFAVESRGASDPDLTQAGGHHLCNSWITKTG